MFRPPRDTKGVYWGAQPRFRWALPPSELQRLTPSLFVHLGCLPLLGSLKGGWHACVHFHARPFVGVFQKSILDRFVNLWRPVPRKMAPKPSSYPKTIPWDTPTNGLLWEALTPHSRLQRDFVNNSEVINPWIYGGQTCRDKGEASTGKVTDFRSISGRKSLRSPHGGPEMGSELNPKPMSVHFNP